MDRQDSVEARQPHRGSIWTGGLAALVGAVAAATGWCVFIVSMVLLSYPVSALTDYEHWWQDLVVAGRIGTVIGFLGACALSGFLLHKLGVARPVPAGCTAALVAASLLAAEHSAAEGGPWTTVPFELVIGIMVVSLLVSYAAVALLARYAWLLVLLAGAGAAGLVTLLLLGELT